MSQSYMKYFKVTTKTLYALIGYKIVEWYATYLAGDNIITCMDNQIREFLEKGW